MDKVGALFVFSRKRTFPTQRMHPHYNNSLLKDSMVNMTVDQMPDVFFLAVVLVKCMCSALPKTSILCDN